MNTGFKVFLKKPCKTCSNFGLNWIEINNLDWQKMNDNAKIYLKFKLENTFKNIYN